MHPDNVQPPLGLGYLASTIINSRNNVSILDFELLGKGEKDIINFIKKEAPHIIGIQCYTYGMNIVREYLKTIKNYKKSIFTILGGPQVTSAPIETLEYMSPYIDYLITGEAEFEIVKLINCLAADKPPSEKIISSSLIENLDDLPFPLWEQMNPSIYPPAPHGAFYKNFPVAPIVASRGCPYNCYFCEATFLSGSRVRYRSVENIMEEIKYLIDRFGVKEIHFVDDNFTFKKDFVMNFCDKITSKGIKLSFACPNGIRIDSIDKELLLMMKKAGFYSLAVGIESGSQKTLDKINKKIKLEEIKNKVKLINEVGISPVGFFIIGLPFEKIEDIEETINFACSLKLNLANFMLYHPLPKTVLFEQMKNNGDIKDINLNAISFSHIAYKHPKINRSTLKYLQIKAFVKFFMKPEILLWTIKGIKSFKHFRYIIKRIQRWLITSWFN